MTLNSQKKPTTIGRYLRSHDIIGNKRLGIVGFLPMSEQTFSNVIKRGEFPKPIKIGRLCYWLENDIKKYLADLANQSKAA